MALLHIALLHIYKESFYEGGEERIKLTLTKNFLLLLSLSLGKEILRS